MSAPTERGKLPGLTLAALGIVYGDIGTSPLYAFREAFNEEHGIPLTPENVFAVLSMMFWAVTVIVSLKYVTIMLRFDNRGEGGVLALLSWASKVTRRRPELTWLVTMLGIFSASLFYGDAVITPAISVLSAVEGIAVKAQGLGHFVMPLALVILVCLFAVQRRGTATVGAIFGPIMVMWFGTLAAFGAVSIAETPMVLQALNPKYAVMFIAEYPGFAFLASSAVFLCLTGAEALYADMGHFGPKPVRLAWFTMVFPALMINYFGQGALVLRAPEAARNPFYLLAPDVLLVPLIVLATAATVIASQATISGAFSATQQASRLNLLPRLQVRHTSEVAQGQIYIPLVNWMLLALVVALVLMFQSSDNLASAYGIAVAGDLFLSSVILLITLPMVRAPFGKRLWPFFLVFALLEGWFLASNGSKIVHGGWFPLALATIMFTLLSSWRTGIEVLRAKKDLSKRGIDDGLVMNLEEEPRVDDDERVEVRRGLNGMVRLTAHFGFREDPDIRTILRLAARKGVELELESTSFFTSKPTVVSVSPRGLFGWRRSLFGWMLQNSVSVARYFDLPPNRIIELGSQVGI
jgi:KUP system potassium uptake protein